MPGSGREPNGSLQDEPVNRRPDKRPRAKATSGWQFKAPEAMFPAPKTNLLLLTEPAGHWARHTRRISSAS